MQSEDWEKIKRLLDEVMPLGLSERQDFLANSGASAEIRAEVESLLAFEKDSESFLSIAAGTLAGDLVSDEWRSNPVVGQKIGIYEITKELGLGGMGAVYLALRADGKFEQKVALKLLKREFNVEKIRRNFRRESEIQSKLDHPFIARLLDTGTTADGVPYLVMEYVEGETIDKFCEKHELTLTARLKLFNKVCEAVAYAHRNLIIHRDLKPSNILVTEKGEPKLLDFGISKLLTPEDTDAKTAVTGLGAMTPEYASPEQLKGGTVTTATDIYSLGVVLYKMLTGAHPYNLTGKINGKLVNTLSEAEPGAPSAVPSFKSRPPAAMTEAQWRKALRGDIDNIILKSLRKAPERRYQTVEQFSADIWRFIDGLPVSARPVTALYRVGKFFRRNKIAVAAAGLIVLSLLTGIAVAAWQASVAGAQARIAEDARAFAENETSKAKAEQEKSEKISRFMAKIISYGNPAWYSEGSKFGGDARVIDVIEDLSAKIDPEFSGEPDVAAELHHKFAEVFLFRVRMATGGQIEKYRKKQIFHSLRALELRKQVYGEWHELVAKDLFYSYGVITEDPGERGRILARAIVMMRETNPNNLNFPYMLDAYAAGLILPGFEKYYEPYLNAVTPPTGENRFQIAERYLREALPVLRLHYKTENTATYMTECHLSYALARQEKWTDFDEHFAICKQGIENNKGDLKTLIWHFELAEKAGRERK